MPWAWVGFWGSLRRRSFSLKSSAKVAPEQHHWGGSPRRCTVLNDELFWRASWQPEVGKKVRNFQTNCIFFSLVSHLANSKALYEETKYKCLGTKTTSDRKSISSGIRFSYINGCFSLSCALTGKRHEGKQSSLFSILVFKCSTLQNNCFVSSGLIDYN